MRLRGLPAHLAEHQPHRTLLLRTKVPFSLCPVFAECFHIIAYRAGWLAGWLAGSAVLVKFRGLWRRKFCRHASPLLACASALAPRWPPCARPCEWLRTSESYLGALIETCRYCVQCLCFCQHRCCALQEVLLELVDTSAEPAEVATSPRTQPSEVRQT